MGANLSADDLTLWEAAAKKAGLVASRQDLFFILPKFNPLFDANDKFIGGAIAKYAKRLEQIPTKAIDEWTAQTGGDRLMAAISLTAENSVFPNEKYSDSGLRGLATKFAKGPFTAERKTPEVKAEPTVIRPATQKPPSRVFKVGEKVKLPGTRQLRVRDIDWAPAMDGFIGMDATVTKIDPDLSAQLDIDKGAHWWAFEWLTPIRDR